MASWSGARSLIQGCCVDRLRTSSVADADRRRPSQYSIGDEALGRLTPRPRQHNPHRRLAIVDTTVAYCLSVIRLLSSWHQNQLQCDSVRLLNHGVPADLDRGAMVNIVRIGRKAAIHELQSRYAVRDLRLLQARKRCTLRIELSPPCQLSGSTGRWATTSSQPDVPASEAPCRICPHRESGQRSTPRGTPAGHSARALRSAWGEDSRSSSGRRPTMRSSGRSRRKRWRFALNAVFARRGWVG